MPKLKLELDELAVQSFETTTTEACRRGTVRGQRFEADTVMAGVTEDTCTGEACACETVEATCPDQWSCPCNSIGCPDGGMKIA